ncbi:hypothetical protein GCM10007937_24340 [Mesorhizobium albiziae]|nr:hypothetical protein GCM10007937_24340 [Mesorhizobium albiziae]
MVEYHRYKPGTPRYRFLRLPFYDQMFSADKPLVTSYFQSYTGGRSLEIASAVAYIGNNHHDSHMEACLKRSRHGLETERFCFPPADQDSPGQITLNWRIHQGERLALDCHYPPSDKVSSGDCAIYLVAKLPDDLKLSPENSFRDYGELPRDYVTDWCEATAKVVTEEIVHNPMLCLGKEGDTCSHAQKMTNCVASLDLWSFPKASCMADNSCYLPTHRLEGLLGLLGILGAVGIAALARRMA